MLTNNAGNLSWKPRKPGKPREQASKEVALSNTSLALAYWALPPTPPHIPSSLMCDLVLLRHGPSEGDWTDTKLPEPVFVLLPTLLPYSLLPLVQAWLLEVVCPWYLW